MTRNVRLRENGQVVAPELVPRRTIGGIIAVWIVAALVGIAIAVFVPLGWRAQWLAVGLAGCLIASFLVQLAYGRSQGFTQRVGASVLGAFVVLGMMSLGFGLASLFSV